MTIEAAEEHLRRGPADGSWILGDDGDPRFVDITEFQQLGDNIVAGFIGSPTMNFVPASAPTSSFMGRSAATR
jgi:hypothetical protein